MLMWQIMCILL